MTKLEYRMKLRLRHWGRGLDRFNNKMEEIEQSETYTIVMFSILGVIGVVALLKFVSLCVYLGWVA